MSFIQHNNGQPPKAAIFGCAGLSLTDEERRFFADENPFGFILFARNCDTPEQVASLTQQLREAVGGRDVPVLIDQEGGRVARLKPPHWRKYPPARELASLAERDMGLAADLIALNSRLIAGDLLPLGINVDCLPLADVPVQGSHDIIGDRAYGHEPERVANLARAAAEGLLDGGVLPVLKHIPGHGRAMVDSHESLPVVSASLAELERDFAPFRALSDLPLGMTAHVLYKAIDDRNVATLSTAVIALIRDDIGFDGLLMTDDVSMKALSGDIGALSARSLAAGCDVVLHCNGKMEEMRAIAAGIGTMSDEAQERAERAWAQLQKPQPLDAGEAVAQLRAHLPGHYA